MKKALLLSVFFLTKTATIGQTLPPAFIEFCALNQQLFLDQVSRFYPLTEPLLDRFHEDWNWRFVSKNKNIAWSPELIARYENKLQIHDLLSNSGIIWTTGLIEKYEKHKYFDVFFLSTNPSLEVTEMFLDKYAEGVSWRGISSNPSFLYQDALVKKFKDKIENLDSLSAFYVPKALIDDYIAYQFIDKGAVRAGEIKAFPEALQAIRLDAVETLDTTLLSHPLIRWNWSSLSSCTKFPWSINFIYQYAHRWRELEGNEGVYQKIYSNYLNDNTLIELMEQLFPLGQLKYYMLCEADDQFGIYPGVEAENEIFKKSINNESANEQFPEITCSLGGIYEPPLRFVDLHGWGYAKPYGVNAITVSEKVKSVLEQFNLPPHKFYPIKLAINDSYYGQDTQSYFIFHIPECDYKYLDFDRVVIYQKPTYHGLPYHYNIPLGPLSPSIKNSAEYLAYLSATSQNLQNNDLAIHPYIWKADFDLMACKGEDKFKAIWVSEAVKEALEAVGVVGLKFQPIRESSPIMLGAETKDHRTKNRMLIEKIRREWAAKEQPPTQLTILNFRKASAKKDSILAQKGMVKLAHQKLPPPAPGSIAETLRKKEEDWEVLLPPKYFDMLVNQNFSADFRSLAKRLHYQITSVEHLSQFAPGWYNYFPHMVKGIVIAEYGRGSSLCLLLKPYSSYELDDIIYEQGYETGEMTPVGKL